MLSFLNDPHPQSFPRGGGGAIISLVTDSHPHWQRSAIIASIGLIIATVSIIWVGLAIRAVGPETLSLAYRIDAKQTLAFVRTSNSASLKASIQTVNAAFEEKNTAIDFLKLPEGTSYEYALLQHDSNTQPEWALSVHLRNQEETVMTSRSGTSLFLPIRQIKMSLGAAPFFRTHEKEGGKGILYVSLRNVPALTSSGSGLLGAVLDPFSSLLSLQDTNGWQWILEKKQRSLFTANKPLLPLPEHFTAPLFTFTLGDPPAFWELLDRTLRTKNPNLFEGIEGILRKKLEQITNRTDLKLALKDLFGNGGQVMIAGEPNEAHFLIEGIAQSAEALKPWMQSVRSAATPAVIRSQVFLHGDSRTDVTAAPKEALMQEMNEWEVPSGSGSSHPFMVAAKGKTVLLSNGKEMLRQAMQNERQLNSAARGLMNAVIDIRWLIRSLEGAFLTENETSLLESLFGSTVGTFTLEAEDGREAVNVRLRMAP